MIYTLTLNPALDYDMYLDNLIPGDPNTAQKTILRAGGKGLTVSKMLNRLGKKSVALGFAGGFAGDFITNNLREEGIKSEFIHLDELTRINVKLKNNGVETEITGISPNIEKWEIYKLIFLLEKQVQEGDILVMAGSVPKRVSTSIYHEIVEAIPSKVKTALDTRGNRLKENINHNLLIKPNISELEDMFGKKFNSTQEIIKDCQYFLDKGVENIIVSMDKRGALLVTNKKNYFATPAKGELINSVGAGDSVVAGFICGISENKSVADSFKLGIASGTATAYSYKLAEKDFVEEIYAKTVVEEIS